MDLGIKDKRAIVCASSKGLGRACAEKLAEAGVHLVLDASSEGPLRETAARIASTYGVKVKAVAADVTTEEGRAALLEAEPHADILINNAGGPPPGLWSDWDRDDWIKALDANMLTPILLSKAVLPSMISRGWGRIVNITSGSVKSPIAPLGLSNGARTGLTGFVAGTARQVARSGVIMNNLLPGSHDTDRIEVLMQNAARQQNISAEQARQQAEAANPTGHFGRPGDFGATCAFLCSQYAGYIVGQNWLLDGGAFVSTFG